MCLTGRLAPGKIHAEHRGAYGVRRIHAELQAGDRPVNRKRVARLTRERRITGRHLRRRKRTTIPDLIAPPGPDLIERDFIAEHLNERAGAARSHPSGPPARGSSWLMRLSSGWWAGRCHPRASHSRTIRDLNASARAVDRRRTQDCSTSR
ncbi:IS3 family transposase [Kitasatospora sp. NPDC048365]|uniref:IS3 family transposase n=1 Tax=Kitasatospora sp. NPDC048365 TaxID=3364050 RepID=UPI00371D7A1B